MYIEIIRVRMGYITGEGPLPDIYTHDAQGHAAPEGECGYIRQNITACGITNMLHFLHS